MSKTIKFIKNSGEIKYKEYVLNNLENAFKMIPNGEHIITISKLVKKRTIDQNRLMWLWLTCLGRDSETGSNKDEFYEYYCYKFLKERKIVNGTEITVIKGSSKLNTIQFNDFLDNIQADAAIEYGIQLPNPEDLRWKEFEEYYKHFI